MNSVRKKNDVRVAGGIHPEGGAGEAGMAEAADREDLAARAGVGGVDVPPEPTHSDAGRGFAVCGKDRRSGLRGGGLLRAGHYLERLALQRELAWSAREPIQQPLRIEADVGRGGEDARLSGNSA